MYIQPTKPTSTTLTIEQEKTVDLQVQEISPMFAQGNTIRPGLREFEGWVRVTDGVVTGEKKVTFDAAGLTTGD